MPHRPQSLSNSLTRELYPIILKHLDESNLSANQADVRQIYESIQRSNSSLRRKPKPLLQRGIEDVLQVLRDDKEGSDSEGTKSGSGSARSSARKDGGEVGRHANAMNKSIVRGMASTKSVGNGVDNALETRHRATDEEARNGESAAPTTNGTTSKKRSHKQSHQLAERPSKKAKSRDGPSTDPPTHVSLADLGGMDHVIEEFKEYLMLPLKRPERYLRRGLKIPRGILLHGPPGCGKTMLCEALASELSLPFIQIAAPSIVSGMSGESEKALRSHFEHALSKAPSLMFIDEIDSITPKRESAQREMERRIVGQLLTCMDDLALEKTGGRPVIVLAATNRPDSLDPALRRGGRFDKEISIGVPDERVRTQILRAQTRRTRVARDVDFEELGRRTPGFVGADLESLISAAGGVSNVRFLGALQRLSEERAAADADAAATGDHEATAAMEVDDVDASRPKPSETVLSFRRLNTLLDSNLDSTLLDATDALTMSDFLTALPTVQPSSKREGFSTIPETTWSSIGALHATRRELTAAIVQPIRLPARYARFGISKPAGILLYGPPGCGKTLLAKAVANESKANFISVKGPELLNKYVGESESRVRQLFFRARSSQPTVVFFDELDALVPRRDDALSESSARVVNTLLTELDGIASRTGVYVIAATNRPDQIDAAMLRPGRLGKHIYVDVPGPDERVEILETVMRGMPVESEGLKEFARHCDGFSGADLAGLYHEAANRAIDREAEIVEMADFVEAKGKIKPSVGDLRGYERFRRGFVGAQK
ncbi:MAG: hypothetical protein M1828_002805 [Chrysothrix sp. TS-e1954]|nr:MAG: hypothetical protein M1828_002805 [Chrysothrix sp. TS-e1954]